jgi:hypothetical protein
MKKPGLTLVIGIALSAGLTTIGQASTKHSSVTSFITTNTYELTLDSTGSTIGSVGTVTITSNSKSDTLTYKFTLTNGGKLTGVFLDAAGGTAKGDLGPVPIDPLGDFSDSFTAKGKSFSITFKGTDVAHATTFNALQIFAGVNTTKGLFADAVPIPGGGGGDTVPIPGALPLFASGLGAVGFLGWRRRRKTQSLITVCSIRAPEHRSGALVF